MGIPRLTTDLQPYLEDAIIHEDRKPFSTAVRADKIVIDGPGMVYHIYNRLAAYKKNKLEGIGDRDCYNPPNYQELCVAVDTFLVDLEDSGAEMWGILIKSCNMAVQWRD